MLLHYKKLINIFLHYFEIVIYVLKVELSLFIL